MGNRDRFTDEARSIVGALIAARKAAGITQDEIATKMKVDQSRISKFERGERRLDILDFVRYCQAVGIEPGAMLTELSGSIGKLPR